MRFAPLVCAFGIVSVMAAQVSAPAAAPQQVVRVDPVLVKPVAEFSPEQVKALQAKLLDWPQLGRYRAENAALPAAAAGRVVFLGDSITDSWGHGEGNVFFPGKPYLDRGISGQTTPQMLVRFQQDVVALKPVVVVILAGTNDIAGNTGESSPEMTEANFRSMVAIAQGNGIRVVLSSVLPASDYPWRPGLAPAAKIVELNRWLRDYAAETKCVYLDYYAALTDEHGGMKPGTSSDGVHPTPAGYAIMSPLAQKAIDAALLQPAP